MLLFDHQTFLLQNYGGISRMFSEIMQYLHDKNYPFELVLHKTANTNLKGKVFYRGKYQEILSEDFIKGISFPGILLLNKIFNIPGRLKRSFLEKIYLNQSKKTVFRYLNQNEKLIFHPTYFDSYYLESIKFKTNVKLVITVFDLIHEEFPGYFQINDLVLKNRKNLLDRSDIIIAISESTKKDLIRLYGIQSEKIKVIHLASNLTSNIDTDKKNYIKEYILFVGDRWIYKNFFRFLEAVAPIIKKHKIIVLCAGSHPFTYPEKIYMQELGIEGKVVHYRFKDDAELASLYKNASLFVFPSLYEGFGIPLLEAMSNECPVVCSNTSSFPEVAGNAASFFDPWNIDSMTYSISNTLESESIKSILVQRGKEVVKKYSWQECGKEHVELYNNL